MKKKKRAWADAVAAGKQRAGNAQVGGAAEERRKKRSVDGRVTNPGRLDGKKDGIDGGLAEGGLAGKKRLTIGKKANGKLGMPRPHSSQVEPSRSKGALTICLPQDCPTLASSGGRAHQ